MTKNKQTSEDVSKQTQNNKQDSQEKIKKDENALNIPLLRFKSFQNEWNKFQIKDLLNFYSTNSFSRSKLNSNKGSVQNIHYGDIHTKFPVIVDCQKIKIPYINQDVDLKKITKESYCKNGDLVIADASEDYEDIGKSIELININDKKIISGLHTLLARDKNQRMYLGFKGYLFQTESIKKQLKTIANGISVLGISKKNVSNIQINIPSIEEQEKIVKFLSLIDRKIVLLEKTLKINKESKEYYLENIFGGSTFDKLNVFNGEYETKNMKQIFKERKETKQPKLELLAVTQTRGILPAKEVNNTDNSNEDKRKYKHVLPGDIAYNSMRMWQGACGVSNKEGIVSPAYTILTPRTDKINTTFYYYYFKSSYALYQFYKYSQGLTSDTWNLKYPMLHNIKLNVPSIEKQNIVANLFQTIDNKIQATQEKIDSLKEFKENMLYNMFV